MIRGMGDSVIAFYAADTGIEHSLYKRKQGTFEGSSGAVGGADYIVVYDEGTGTWKSKGSFAKAKRAIEISVPTVFDFYLTVNPDSGLVAPGNGRVTTVTATLVSPPTQSVSFSASDLSEYDITASFDPTFCDPTCDSELTILTTSSTPTATYEIIITGTGGGLTRTTPYTLTVATGGGCFLAGTEITMAEGSYKNIEDVKVGDLVKYYDFKERKIKETTITKINIHSPEEMGYDYYLIVNDKLRVTPNHPLDKPDGKVIFAGELKIGDVLQGEDGEVEIFSIEKAYNIVTTYSLETESRHYFIDGVADAVKR